MTNPRPNPYVGPRPFTESQREQFHGRQREAQQLFNLLLAERIVMLYSPSGAGKTSLIQAALIPQLKAEDFIVLPTIRLNRSDAVRVMTTKGQVANRYLLSAMLSLNDTKPMQLPLQELADLTLAQDKLPFESYLQAYLPSNAE